VELKVGNSQTYYIQGWDSRKAIFEKKKYHQKASRSSDGRQEIGIVDNI